MKSCKGELPFYEEGKNLAKCGKTEYWKRKIFLSVVYGQLKVK